MKNYLSTNSKMKKNGIYTWGIPAYQSKAGFRTCPGAKACALGCYARQGFYVMPSVAQAQENRLALAQGDGGVFVTEIDAEIKRRRIKRLRIHDAGDFYSRRYLELWLRIIALNPETTFYAYTKMIPLFRGVALPSNFHVIFSEGGRWDSEIKPETDRHSRVFESVAALKRAGYSDAHAGDLPAFRGDQKIGLVYHGHAKRAWKTG